MNNFQEQEILLIKQYLSRQLKGEAKEAFEQHLAQNPALQEELEMYSGLFSALEEEEDLRIKALLQNTTDEDWKTIQTDLTLTPTPQPKRVRILPWAIAATLLFLIGFFCWRYFSGPPPAYFEPATLAVEDLSGEFNRLRSARQIIVPEDQPDYKVETTIAEYYNRGDFQAALNEFKKLPTSAVTLFYSAKCLLALHREPEAITLLKKVETYTAETYSNTAQWLLAVAYFQVGDKGLAKEYAEKAANNEGIEDEVRGLAREMLRRIK